MAFSVFRIRMLYMCTMLHMQHIELENFIAFCEMEKLLPLVEMQNHYTNYIVQVYFGLTLWTVLIQL